MARQIVEVTATAKAPADRVFTLLADRSKVPLWSDVVTCQLHKPGPDDAEGVGAIRRQVTGSTVDFVTIVELVPAKRFAYAHYGLPVSQYRGTVELAETSQGCLIRWSATFIPRYPAMTWLLRGAVRRNLQRHTQGLAAYAAHTDHTG